MESPDPIDAALEAVATIPDAVWDAAVATATATPQK